MFAIIEQSIAMLGSLIFLASFLVKATLVNSGKSCQPFAVKTENLNKRLVGHLLYKTIVPTLFPCMNECVRLGACKSINFIRSEQMCELNSNSKSVLPADIIEDNGSLFVDKSEFPQGIAGPCSSHTCTDTQRCNPIGKTFLCETLECGELPEVENGEFHEGGSVAGTVRKFTCLDGWLVDGTTDVTCLHNQTWSYFNAACTRCDTGWTYYEGLCYFNGQEKMNYSDAEVKNFPLKSTALDSKMFCSQFGARIVTLDTASKKDFIRSFVPVGDRSHRWIGLKDEIVEGEWKWQSNGASLSFSDWTAGQPNGRTNENCAVIMPSQNYEWADIDCINLSRPLCEKA